MELNYEFFYFNCGSSQSNSSQDMIFNQMDTVLKFMFQMTCIHRELQENHLIYNNFFHIDQHSFVITTLIDAGLLWYMHFNFKFKTVCNA